MCPQAKLKWQIFPEFNVSQSLKGKDLLHKLEDFFGCGHIYAHNARNIKQGKWDPLYKYCVRSRIELQEKIIPFFKKYPPIGKNWSYSGLPFTPYQLPGVLVSGDL